MNAWFDLLVTHTWWTYQPLADGGVWRPYHWFNLVEGSVWLTLGTLAACRWGRHRRSRWELVYAVVFALFGLTDFREAFVLQSWLIAVKGVLLAALIRLRSMILKRHYPDRRLF